MTIRLAVLSLPARFPAPPRHTSSVQCPRARWERFLRRIRCKCRERRACACTRDDAGDRLHWLTFVRFQSAAVLRPAATPPGLRPDEIVSPSAPCGGARGCEPARQPGSAWGRNSDVEELLHVPAAL